MFDRIQLDEVGELPPPRQQLPGPQAHQNHDGQRQEQKRPEIPHAGQNIGDQHLRVAVELAVSLRVQQGVREAPAALVVVGADARPARVMARDARVHVPQELFRGALLR